MGDNGLEIKRKNNTGAADKVFKEDTATNYSQGLNTSKGMSFASGNGMNSIFDSEITPVAGKVIEVVNTILANHSLNGKAVPVSISNSKTFKGVAVILTLNKVTYMQPLVFDERNPKTIQEIVSDARVSGTILFAPAILSSQNSKYLNAFDDLVDDETVKLEPMVLISNNYKTDDAVQKLAIDIFKRIEATPFSGVEQDIARDRSKTIQSSFSSSGQNVELKLTHKDQTNSIDDLIVSNTTSMLDIEARVEPILGAKSVTMPDNRQDKMYALRPIVFIRRYSKQGTFAEFNLEYALISTVAATILTRTDRVVSALIPNKDKGVNIGSLNGLFGFHRDPKDNSAKPINFLKTQVGLDVIKPFILTAITEASLGIDLEYKSNTNAFNLFGVLIDGDSDAAKKQQCNDKLLQAYKNLTGLDYNGALIESSFAYPTGKIVFSNGSEMSISDVDPIWLASKEREDLAQEWFYSNQGANSISAKIEILQKLATSAADIEIRLESIGYKIILAIEFINALVKNSKFSIEADPVLDLGVEQKGFSGMNIEITTGVGNAGFTPMNRAGGGFTIVG